MSTSPTSEDKKRRRIDNGETSVSHSESSTPSKPPLKKRFTSNGSIPTRTAGPGYTDKTAKQKREIEDDNEKNDDVADMEEPDRQPKHILLKHMRTAKQNALELEKKAEQLEDKWTEYEAKQGWIRIQWKMLQIELLFFAKMLFDARDNVRLTDLPKEISDISRLRDELDSAQTVAKNFGLRILNLVRTWVERAEKVERICKQTQGGTEKQKSLMDWVWSETQELRAHCEKSRNMISEIESQYSELLKRSETVQREIQDAEERLEQAKENLDECMEKLRRAERRHDCAESKTLASMAGTGLIGPQSTKRDMSPAINRSSEAPSRDVSSTESTSVAEQAAKAQLAEHQQIIEARQKELQELRRDRQVLASEIDKLRDEFATLSDERIMESEYFKSLQQSFEHHKMRYHYLDEMRLQMERELDDMSMERKRLLKELDAEKTSRNSTIEAEMRRLENDLARIRKQRDDFQTNVENQTNKKNRHKKLHDEFVSTAENEKQRILELEKRLSELRERIQSPNENMAGPLGDDDMDAYAEVRMNLENTKAALSYLDQRSDLKPIREEIEKLKKQLAFWSSNEGSDKALRGQVKDLMKKLDDQRLEYDKLHLMIDFFESNESRLLAQIDRVAAIYGKLDEQSAKSIFNLTHHREQKSKLQAEKNKFASTFASLKAAKEAQMANVAAQRRTSEQQQEHVRQLEEREKSLYSQVAEKESEVQQTVRLVNEHRFEMEDLQYRCNEARLSLEQNEITLHELQKMLKEKTKVLDEEKQLQKRAEEEYEKMRQKWERLSQGDNPAEKQLYEECEELRTLLKCSACKTRFRKRLLARCMHTFCKECIDARLETRQRRCPTCGESFGISDVRQFYL